MERTDQAPMEFLEMHYRREFGLTQAELEETPTLIFLRDLHFMSLESKVRKMNS